MIRYALNEPEDFLSLLDFWAKTKEIYFPVFIEWNNLEDESRSSATYRFHTSEYIAEITMYAATPEEVGILGDKISRNNRLIEVQSYEDQEECDEPLF